MEQYFVTGMSCAACQARVEKAVSKVPGVTLRSQRKDGNIREKNTLSWSFLMRRRMNHAESVFKNAAPASIPIIRLEKRSCGYTR